MVRSNNDLGPIAKRSKPRIVVVGGGFAGAYCVQALTRKVARDEAEVVLLDRNNFFVFSPFLVEAGTGALSPRHAVVGLRNFTRGGRFVMGEFRALDTERQRIAYLPVGHANEAEMEYDHLVLATGSVTNLPDVPGLAEHGFAVKSIGDAIALRDRAIRLLEQADLCEEAHERRKLLHFVVVGGNFTGVEVAGEFHTFLRRARHRYENVRPDDIRVTLVEIADRILPGLDRDLSEFAVENLRKRGVEVRLDSSVEQIAAESVRTSGGEVLDAATVIWVAGIAPNPVIAGLNLSQDERGYLLCHDDLRARGEECIWAIGDCAVNPDPGGRPYPATAQHAVRQAEVLARNLVHVLKGEPTRPCVIPNRGTIVALGCRTGVAKIYGIRLAGFWAWFLWRTVYLLKMPGWGRRLRVALEWTVDLIFGRDDVQMGWRTPPSVEPGRRVTRPDSARPDRDAPDPASNRSPVA